RYLAEFEYRFNRRFKLDAIVPRLVRASVQTPPMPGRLLKLAETSW
ncbi:IS1595 family transposase, partial [Nitrosomonas supralitoralis]